MTMTVWLLAIAASVYGGETITVAPHHFATLNDCQHVQRNLPSDRGGSYHKSRCIQVAVVIGGKP